MKKTLLTLSFTLSLAALLTSGAAFAANHEHSSHHPAAQPAATAAITAPAAPAATLTEGEVRKIDKAQGKITLKHGEIKNLDMPGMTMVFRVSDATLLDRVQEGDKVGFSADKIGGQFTVTTIEKK